MCCAVPCCHHFGVRIEGPQLTSGLCGVLQCSLPILMETPCSSDLLLGTLSRQRACCYQHRPFLQLFFPCCVFWCSLLFPSLFHSCILLEIFRARAEYQTGESITLRTAGASPSSFCRGIVTLPRCPVFSVGRARVSRERRSRGWYHSWPFHQAKSDIM